MLPVASLGLLVALLAHTASYGNDHVAGGAYHEMLEFLAAAGAGGFATLLAGLAWLGAGRHANGSILAAGLRPFVPSLPGLLVSGSCWFAIIESIEPGHEFHAPILVVGTCLIAAAWLINATARWFVQTMAAIAFAFVGPQFARTPARYCRLFPRRSSARRTDFIYRRFARPPPGVMLLTI